MLVPIGGDNRVIRLPDGTGGLENYYWSVGTALVGLLGQVLYAGSRLNPVTISLGVAFAIGAGMWAYKQVIRRGTSRRI
jgi:hypothetical protein